MLIDKWDRQAAAAALNNCDNAQSRRLRAAKKRETAPSKIRENRTSKW
ncbi:hypothetical protein [Pseudarthrobacter siccitolerans]|nr:hypothetical protein [Pseudarthrobacter siccitolerans]